jgi:hypothetical protein
MLIGAQACGKIVREGEDLKCGLVMKLNNLMQNLCGIIM